MNLINTSVITCPDCGHQQAEIMPTETCQFFYRCPQCATVLRPRNGDCCVFCSYGSVPCPPIQLSSDCCAQAPQVRQHDTLER